MVSVIGDIQARDEYTHPLGPEANFNESMYFNFFDRARQTGGFVRIGNRANEGYAEVTLCLYLPGGEVLFNYRRPEISSNDAFDAGGLRFGVIEPLVRHGTVYEGTAVYLEDPLQMADPGQAFRQNPHKQVKLDLVHEAVGPLYGSSGAGREIVDPGKEFARAHYEQHMRATGTLTIEGETMEIDGLGLRDHSWGPRYWQALKYYRWLTCNFGPDFGLMVSEVIDLEGGRRVTGVVVRGETLQPISKVAIETEFVPETPYHRRLTATLGLADGDVLTVEGAVKSYIPLRNRRAGHVTHIGEGMTEYRCGESAGYGLSEYLDQVQ
ncbi:MAG: hypothetical protein HYS09_06650 [Chloroflexi bacterium]|nr:hypothetical protein [Chloroflexota bacterium]